MSGRGSGAASSSSGKSSSSSSADMSGSLQVCVGDDDKWSPFHVVVRRNTLSWFTEEKEPEPAGVLTLLDCEAERQGRHGDAHVIVVKAVKKGDAVVCRLAADGSVLETWLEAVTCACIPYTWPGGIGLNKRPSPLLMSRLAGSPEIESPLVRLPYLSAVAVPLRKALLLKKLRLCSVVFDGPDPVSFVEYRDLKRQTLEELVDWQPLNAAMFSTWRVLDDTLTMIRMNLLRTLPLAVPVGGDDPEEDDMPYMDPQWPHLAVCYEFLLQLVSSDTINIHMKKKLIDASFVRQLLLLFDSEDFRERDYLKNIAHRIYSKLTQRRALIRRVICNIFFEFVFETDRHNGIGEMLEILASIINGFCVPIKEEHKVMLVRALLPLHKSPNVVSYHPQLSYCMALYVAKDHTLTREVVLGLLKYWPFGSSVKQNMFLNELEDVFEYVKLDDLEVFRDQLAIRLAKAIGGLHFQVAERTLGLWNSEQFAQHLLLEPTQRRAFFPAIFPVLYINSRSHWHDSVQAVSSAVLQQYMEVDSELYSQCASQLEARESARALEDEKLMATPAGVDDKE